MFAITMDLERVFAIVLAEGHFSGRGSLVKFLRALVIVEDQVIAIPASTLTLDPCYGKDKSADGKLNVRGVGLMKMQYHWNNVTFDITDAATKQAGHQQRQVLEYINMTFEGGSYTRRILQGLQADMHIGDCDQAMCYVAHNTIPPVIFAFHYEVWMASATSKYQIFSETAEEFARDKGHGLVFLKQYNKAFEDGNKTILFTGSNQHGRTTRSKTASSDIRHDALLRQIFPDTKMDPTSKEYFEAKSEGAGIHTGGLVEKNSLGTFILQEDDVGVVQSAVNGQKGTNVGNLDSSSTITSTHDQFVSSFHWTAEKSFTSLQSDCIVCNNFCAFGGTNVRSIIHQFPDLERIKCGALNMPTKSVPQVSYVTATERVSLNWFQNLN